MKDHFIKMQKSMGNREVIYGTHVTKDTERGWRSEAFAEKLSEGKLLRAYAMNKFHPESGMGICE